MTKSLCKNCQAPIDPGCACEDCRHLSSRIYCHICFVLYGVIIRSEKLSREHTIWQNDQDARRNRMGL